MKTINVNGHTVKVYDSIESMPITVFHRFNLFVSIDAGIGGTVEDVDRRLFRIGQFIKHKQTDSASAEIDNLRQAIAFVIEKSNPELLSFATLVYSVDGQPVEATDETECRELLNRLAKHRLTVGTVRQVLDSVKKKWMQKWRSISRRKKTVQD